MLIIQINNNKKKVTPSDFFSNIHSLDEISRVLKLHSFDIEIYSSLVYLTWGLINKVFVDIT